MPSFNMNEDYMSTDYNPHSFWSNEVVFWLGRI